MSVALSIPIRNESAQLAARNGEQTFWEVRAETQWGRYITAIERAAILSAQATFNRPGKCLDIGCEGGRWSTLLSGLGWQMTGIDIDPKTLRLCQERNRSMRCVLVGEGDRPFPIETDSMDLLLCLEVRVADFSWFPAEAARVLRPGGKLVGTSLNLLSWRGVAGTLKSTVNRCDRHYVKAYSSLRNSLRENGFHVDSARGCCWAPFGRESNSSWISLAAKMERWLRLDKLTDISPWVIYSATLSSPADAISSHKEGAATDGSDRHATGERTCVYC
jgi:SAM-dependent methyltransferase